jgi:RimJ/RimL family protein N-acetyltransferase
VTDRFALVALTSDVLAMMLGERDGERPFAWPDWWPDDVDRGHLRVWSDRAGDDANVAWGPRAIVLPNGHMIGSAGFHVPPQPLEVALEDPTFVGRRDPLTGGAVEIGYSIFPEYRGNGYATEAVAALIDWAARTGEVGAVLAAVGYDNVASQRVLERVGGFVEIGTCEADATREIVYRRDLYTAPT